jgi:hypothetical protein
MINTKFVYLDQQSLGRLGTWLSRRYREALKKSTEAKDELYTLEIALEQINQLSLEWDEAKQYHQAQIPSALSLFAYCSIYILILG